MFGEDSPEFSLRIFGDIGMHGDSKSDHSKANFSFGSLDFVISGSMGERLTFFSESLIEGEHADAIFFDQERAWVAWNEGDSFYLQLGMDNSVISRWNRLYNHGRWLETTITRPFLATFEDQGGVLPMHFQGLEIGGLLAPAAGDLEWVAIIANGRGADIEDRQRVHDDNTSKSFSTSLTFTPSSMEALTFGAAALTDIIPADLNSAVRNGSISEQIYDAYFTWLGEQLEWIGEYAWVIHHDGVSGSNFSHRLIYLQMAMPLDDWTPYTRFDLKVMDQNDPYFVPVDQDLDQWQQLLGVRHELTASSAIKLEIGFGHGQDRDAGGAVSSDDFISAALQISWTF
jgi:hypothetical protein